MPTKNNEDNSKSADEIRNKVLNVSDAIQRVANTSYKIQIVTQIDGDTMQARANREQNSIEVTWKLASSFDDDELAFVMAHEVAHFTNKDKQRIEEFTDQYKDKLIGSLRKSDKKMKESGRGFLSRAFVTVGGIALGTAGAYLLIRQEAQKYEAEADRRSLQYMQLAGYDASKATSALMKLHGGSIPDLSLWEGIVHSVSSTHPLPSRRIEEISKKLRT